MRSKPIWLVGFAATFLVTACASTPSTSPSPIPVYQPPQGVNNDLNNSYSDDRMPMPSPTEIPIISATPNAETPVSPVQMNGQGLMDPQGMVMNPYQFGSNLPVCIPQQYANLYLQALNGCLINPYMGNFTAREGMQYGCSPDLMNYGAFSQCMYYPYYNYYVPYILVGNYYYPYGYASCYNYAGWYEYPWLYYYNDCYYPYSYMSHSYCYGYMDCESNWPRYRERYHHDYDSDYARSSERRGREFTSWRDEHINREVSDSGNSVDRVEQYFKRFQKNHSGRNRSQKQENNYQRPGVQVNRDDDAIQTPPKRDRINGGAHSSKNSNKVEEKRNSKKDSGSKDDILSNFRNLKTEGNSLKLEDLITPDNDAQHKARVERQRNSKERVGSQSEHRSNLRNERKNSSTMQGRKSQKGKRNVHSEEEITDEVEFEVESGS